MTTDEARRRIKGRRPKTEVDIQFHLRIASPDGRYPSAKLVESAIQSWLDGVSWPIGFELLAIDWKIKEGSRTRSGAYKGEDECRRNSDFIRRFRANIVPIKSVG